MARTRRRLLQEDAESLGDTAVHASSIKPAQAPGIQALDTDKTVARPAALATRKGANVPQKASKSGRKADKASNAKVEIEWYPEMDKLADWEFHDKVNRGALKMIKPSYSHEHHFFKLPDAENPALKIHNRAIPTEDRPAIKGQCAHVATAWSQYFTDALYGHPLKILKPQVRVKDCHIIGLLNGDLIIDATSRLRPGSMYWTLNEETRMLQHIKPCAKRLSGPVKEPEIPIGEVGQYLNDKGPLIKFGVVFPPQTKRKLLSIRRYEDGTITEFDGRKVVGGQLVLHSRAGHAAAEGIDDMAEVTSTAIPAFLEAISTAVYNKARLTAFNVESRLKRKRQDDPESSTFKRARASRPEDEEFFLNSDGFLGQSIGDVTTSVTAALSPFFEALSLSIYDSARKAAFTAEMKKRKSEDEIEEPSPKRPRPNAERGERERFSALRAVVGIRMATAIQDLLRGALRKATADFRRRRRISWSPSPSKHDSDDDDDDEDDDEHGANEGVVRDTEKTNSSRQEPDDDEGDDDEGDNHRGNAGAIKANEDGARHRPNNEHTPVSGSNRDWGGHPPVRRDEDEKNFVVRTNDFISDGEGNFIRRDKENPGDEKDDSKGGKTEAKTNETDGKRNTAKSREGEEESVVGTYDYRNEPPLPRRPHGNEAYECTPERPEDDYMMSGAIGPESAIGSPARSSTNAGDEKDGAKQQETESDTNRHDGNKSINEHEPPPDEPETGPNNATELAEPELAEPELAEPEVAEPESPIDQATLDRIAVEQKILEIQRTMERNSRQIQ